MRAPPPAAPPFSLVTVGARGGYGTHPLPRGEVSVGSGPQCALRLEGSGAAPLAALLVVGEREVTLEPAAAGVLLDGKEVAAGQRYPLRPGATFHVGQVLLTLHAAPRVNARRLWPHGSFEMRLEEQRLRAASREESFVLLRLRLVDPGAAQQTEELLSNTLRLTDVLGVYGPGVDEVLLPETSLEEAGAHRGAHPQALRAASAPCSGSTARRAPGTSRPPRSCSA